MFRAFVFLAVLTVAAGPGASVLCQAWCVSEAVTHECRHEGSEQSPVLTAGDCCAGVEASAPATVTKSLLTTVRSLDAVEAIPGHAGLASRLSAAGRHRREPRRPRPFDPAPLSTVLRI